MSAYRTVAIDRMWLISPRLALLLTLPDPAPILKGQVAIGH